MSRLLSERNKITEQVLYGSRQQRYSTITYCKQTTKYNFSFCFGVVAHILPLTSLCFLLCARCTWDSILGSFDLGPRWCCRIRQCLSLEHWQEAEVSLWKLSPKGTKGILLSWKLVYASSELHHKWQLNIIFSFCLNLEGKAGGCLLPNDSSGKLPVRFLSSLGFLNLA